MLIQTCRFFGQLEILSDLPEPSMAAEKALELFEGKTPGEIAVVKNFLGQYYFDYKQLRKSFISG